MVWVKLLSLGVYKSHADGVASRLVAEGATLYRVHPDVFVRRSGCYYPPRLSLVAGNVAQSCFAMLSVSRPGSCLLVEVVLVVGTLSTSTASYSRFSRLVIGVAIFLCGTRLSGLGSTMSPSVAVDASSGNVS